MKTLCRLIQLGLLNVFLLRFTNLKYTDFTGATVDGANFTDTYWYLTTWIDGERYNDNQAD